MAIFLQPERETREGTAYFCQESLLDGISDDIRTMSKKQRYMVNEGIKQVSGEDAAMRTCLKAEADQAGSWPRLSLFSAVLCLIPLLMPPNIYAEGAYVKHLPEIIDGENPDVILSYLEPNIEHWKGHAVLG